MIPSSEEWDTSELGAVRQQYLEAGLSFEQITDQIASTAKIVRAWIRPYENSPLTSQAREARQVCFRARICQVDFDLFYNSPDGLRGRYWQTAERGVLATRYFIETMKPLLISHWPVVQHVSGMTVDDVFVSLDAASAKVWPRETNGEEKIDPSRVSHYPGPELRVRRWAANEEVVGGKGRSWRGTPPSGELEVKGALIDRSQQEHVPDSKRDRCCQIHRFGFT